MKVKIFITTILLGGFCFCHAQNFLKQDEKSKSLLFRKPLEYKFDTSKFLRRLSLESVTDKNNYFKHLDNSSEFSYNNALGKIYNSKVDNMSILIPDSATTNYLKPLIHLFSEIPATVYYLPNALKKTLLFDPKPTMKALMMN